MKKISIDLRISTTTAAHLLGGLAASYRIIPASAPESVSRDLKYTMVDVLTQMEQQGVAVLQSKSPFNSYAKLVGYNGLPF